MSEAARQQQLINTLKAFNNAVVALRLYPASSPQIENAFERGYKSLKNHLREDGPFSLTIEDGVPYLCGTAVDPGVLSSIANLILYRQLQLLRYERFVINRGLDRKIFRSVLELFNAKANVLKSGGGGRSLIKKLNLENFFPEDVPQIKEAEKNVNENTEKSSGDTQSSMIKEFIDVLLDREKRTAIVNELRTKLSDVEEGGDIVAAAIRAILRGLIQKKQYATSEVLKKILVNSHRLTGEGKSSGLYLQAARKLIQDLDSPALMLLLYQDFNEEPASTFSTILLQQVPLERFGEVLKAGQQQKKRFHLTASSEKRQLSFLEEGENRLLGGPKGKQYQGLERAQNLIKAGEKARRAKRAEANVKALIQGKTEVLRSEEFNLHLPLIVQKMDGDGMEKEVRALLRRLNSSFLEGDASLKRKVIGSISQIGEHLTLEQNWVLVNLLAESLIGWLEQSVEPDFVYERTCQVLQKMMTHSWQSGENDIGDRALSIFYRIRSGNIEKPERGRELIELTQDKGVDHDLLSHLLDDCLQNPKDEILSRRLILQGPLASRFLVESLIRAEETNDRIKILDLLTYGEQFLPPILLEKLAEPMPWYGKRNLLKLLSETGSIDHVDHIYPFLHHEDLRVQREAFVCLYKISGRERKKVLLHALTEASETMKLQIVRALVPMADVQVTQGFGQILEEHRFYSVEFRDTLLANTCIALARCPYPEAEQVLQDFLALRGSRTARKIGDRVWKTAQDSLKRVVEDYQNERQIKAKAGKSAASLKVSQAGKTITGLSEEARIRSLLAKGDTAQAKTLLLEVIEKTARRRRFSQAEQLRDWLIEIDSLALTDIIRAAEIIEHEKHAAVNKDHLETWAGLFDVLSTEEFSTFYHGLEHIHCSNEEMIMKKGSNQQRLFFINSGRVKLFFPDKKGEVLLKTLHKGQIFGHRTFFSASVWTVNAVALGHADLSVLEKDALQSWHEQYPALESKLQDYCSRFESASEGLAGEGKDRREFSRHTVKESRISGTLLDRSGVSTGVNLKGDLTDISRGGLCFFLRISKKDNARMLLGRKLQIVLPQEQTGGQKEVYTGEIAAVHAHHAMENEYSVHVEFDHLLASNELQRVLSFL